MAWSRRATGIVVVGGWAVLTLCSVAAAQTDLNTIPYGSRTSRSSWEQRVLQRDRSQILGSMHDPVSYRVAQNGATQPAQAGAGQVAPVGVAPPSILNPSEARGEEIELVPKGRPIAPVPMDEQVVGKTRGTYEMGGMGQPGCSSCGGSGCGSCGGPDCGGCDDCNGECSWGGPFCWGMPAWWFEGFSIFAGVQGFKGASDLGRNGNFGFHEGVNFSGPLGDPWGIGYQAGMQAVHSNFKGTQTLTTDGTTDNGSRNQIFFTGGLFHRAHCGGLQGGVVVDYFHDNYFEATNLTQLRTECALVAPDCGEIGFWGAFGVGKDQVEARRNGQTLFNRWLTPTDMYAAFWRRYFSGGGQGRLWVGVTGMRDVVFGGEIMVPLGTSWALENNFTFLSPRQGRATGGQAEESWSVALQLVWYPGRCAQSVRQSPYFPMFTVADNSVFMVDHR